MGIVFMVVLLDLAILTGGAWMEYEAWMLFNSPITDPASPASTACFTVAWGTTWGWAIAGGICLFVGGLLLLALFSSQD